MSFQKAAVSRRRLRSSPFERMALEPRWVGCVLLASGSVSSLPPVSPNPLFGPSKPRAMSLRRGLFYPGERYRRTLFNQQRNKPPPVRGIVQKRTNHTTRRGVQAAWRSRCSSSLSWSHFCSSLHFARGVGLAPAYGARENGARIH
jgi:hypothetical protein